MELKERLKAILKEEFGIETDEELMEAVKEIDDSALAVFTTPARRDYARTA